MKKCMMRWGDDDDEEDLFEELLFFDFNVDIIEIDKKKRKSKKIIGRNIKIKCFFLF